ncbi:TRAP transporter large permease [Shumkonia mesophila]|uniref:TRAP transporter large permease n=1 Tax=Shumkonia mesophila TaxID=2838854 RepID=UPI0029350536|nr:TRAP transporter large permease [Shumkonia mesophila]
MALLSLFAALLALILIGVPVILSLGAVGLAGMLMDPEINPALFPQKMFGILDSFSLLALPYFILAGVLMSEGGISRQLVRFAETLVGHLRGGLGHASVVSSMVFAGVSGSSTADASAISSIIIPTMKGAGYRPGFAAGLIACAGTIGAIIPPSMVMVVYGSMAQVSIGGLFLGGIIPGVLVGLALMLTIKIHTFIPAFTELRVTTGRFRLSEVFRATAEVWPALLAPLIIVGGILSGMFTATEAGIVACFYAFLVSKFVYKRLNLRDLPKILLDAAVTTAMVSGIIGVAGGFGWLLTYMQFNELALAALTAAASGKTGILFLLAITMLVLTMFVEATAILIIFVPVAVYIGNMFSVDPFQMGLIMVMSNQIGSTTPPVAVLLFVTTSIAETTFDQTVKYVWPFILAEIAILVVVILFQPISSAIPHFFLG